MSIQHAVKVFETPGFHTATQRLVLLEAAYRADRKGVIRHSQSELAAETALSRRAVAQWFKCFEEAGVLVHTGHGRYRLNLEALDDEPEAVLRPIRALASIPGADEELQRLEAIRTPSQCIRFRRDGWPVLAED